MRKIFPFIALVLVLVSGCASLDKTMTGAGTMPSKEDREKSATQFADLTPEQHQQFIDGQAWIGMTQAELQAMWGNEPKKSQRKLSSKGNEDIQLYHVRVGDWKTGVTSKYFKVTLLEGKVSELQELDGNVGSFDKL